MQRIKFEIDFDNKEILTEDVENAIVGAIKSEVRSKVSSVYYQVIDRLIKEKSSKILLNIESGVSRYIDDCLGEFVKKEVDKYLCDNFDLILKLLKDAIEKKVECVNLEALIDSRVRLVIGNLQVKTVQSFSV